MSRTLGDRVLRFAVLAVLAGCGAEQFQPGGTGGVAPTTGSGGDPGPVDVSEGTGGAGGVIDPGTGGTGAFEPIGGSGGQDAVVDVSPDTERPDVPADVVMCPAGGTDTDGDGLSDCTEANDGDPWTDAAVFNGLSVTVRATGATGTCADLKDYNTMATRFPSITEVKNMSAGWAFDTDQDTYYDAAYGFTPNWTSRTTGNFRLRYRGVINLKAGGQHCFKVDTGSTGAAIPDACAQVYVNSGPGKSWLAQNGYMAAAAEGTACVTLPAGTYPFDIVYQHANPAHRHKLAVLYCAGGGSACAPTQPLPNQMVRPPSCVSSADCTCEFYGGHAYRFCRAGKNFTDARAACVTSGMKLVRLNDAAENQWVYDVTVAEALTSIWIGATDSALEGDWRWVDGTPFWSGKGPLAGGSAVGGLYSAWDGFADEPNVGVDEDCAGYWRPRPTWADLTCTDANAYICESY
jgi:hypothetical protein